MVECFNSLSLNEEKKKLSVKEVNRFLQERDKAFSGITREEGHMSDGSDQSRISRGKVKLAKRTKEERRAMVDEDEGAPDCEQAKTSRPVTRHAKRKFPGQKTLRYTVAEGAREAIGID